MPLTPEEQKELEQLNSASGPKAQGGLSPAEQAELEQLTKGATPKSGTSSQVTFQNPAFQKVADAYRDPDQLQMAMFNSGAGQMAGAASQGYNALKRILLGGAQGAAVGARPREGADATDRIAGGITGGALGAATSGAVEGIGALGGAASRPTDTAKLAYRMSKDPAGIEAENQQLLGGAVDKLRAKGTEEINPKLEELLKGKQVQVDPAKVQGINPEVDTIMRKYQPGQAPEQAFKELAGLPQEPQPISMDALAAKKAKEVLDQSTKFRKSDLFSRAEVPAEQASAELANRAAAAQTLRGAVKGADPEAPGLYSDWQQSLKLADKLQKGANSSPSATLNPTLLRKGAALQGADELVGTDLFDRGKQLASARNLSKKVEHGKFGQSLGILLKEALKGGAKSLGSGPQSPTQQLTLEALLNAANQPEDKR